MRRNVVVTGAAGGIGTAICLRLARSGFGVFMLDRADCLRAHAAQIGDAGGRCEYAQVDLTDPRQTEAALQHAASTLGSIDGLVNNAAIVDHVAPLTRMSIDRWKEELDVNLTVPFRLAQALLPGMVARGWGRIVNIASLAGRTGLFLQAGYACSKSGLLGLTRAIALEHARHGITCNSVLPGLIDTPAVSRLPKVLRDDALALVPARRTGRPEEVAALVAFLCTDDAAYVNGAEIDVSGGAQLGQTVLGSVKEVTGRRGSGAPES